MTEIVQIWIETQVALWLRRATKPPRMLTALHLLFHALQHALQPGLVAAQTEPPTAEAISK